MYNELCIIRKGIILLLYDHSALTLKNAKMALNPFCDETLQIVPGKLKYYATLCTKMKLRVVHYTDEK